MNKFTKEQMSKLTNILCDKYLNKLDVIKGLSFSTTVIECVLHPELKEVFDDMLVTVQDYVENLSEK